MKILFLAVLFTISFTILAKDNRVSQLIEYDGNSSINIEVGAYSGLSVNNKRMQLSFGYSFFLVDGFSISTDIFLLDINKSWLNYKVGIGSGIIFRPEQDNFESDFLFRIPNQFIHNSLFLSITPIIGTSMFKYNLEYKVSLLLSIGYRFKISRNNTSPNKTS